MNPFRNKNTGEPGDSYINIPRIDRCLKSPPNWLPLTNRLQMSHQLALPKFPGKKWWANEFPNFASPVAFVSFLARWKRHRETSISKRLSNYIGQRWDSAVSVTSCLLAALYPRNYAVESASVKNDLILNLTRWFYHKMWWIYWWHFDEAHVNPRVLCVNSSPSITISHLYHSISQLLFSDKSRESTSISSK